VVRKEKSKIKHINIPIQLDLWGNEVIFRESDRQRYMDTQGQKHKVFPKILNTFNIFLALKVFYKKN
jgi:hypothetical protein